MFILFLITQIGIKPDNLILSEFGKYNVPLFLSDDFDAGSSSNTGSEVSGADKPSTKNLIRPDYMNELACGYVIGPPIILMSAYGNALGIVNTELFICSCFLSVLGTSSTVTLIGKLMHQRGSFIKSTWLTAATLGVGFLFSILANNAGLNYRVEIGVAIGAILAMPIAAVIGYNWR